MRVDRPTDDLVICVHERGRGLAARVAESTLYLRFEGHIVADLFAPTMAPSQRILASAPSIAVYLDALLVDGYDSKLRHLWVDWIATHRRRIAGVHILVRSAILRMGVQVANLAVQGMIESYAQRSELERRLRQDAPHFARHATQWADWDS